MSSEFNTFTCPNCGALYQIIKVEAGPESDSREIVCLVCGGPLAAREGEFVLKYFLQSYLPIQPAMALPISSGESS
jgi:hypothetical protein